MEVTRNQFLHARHGAVRTDRSSGPADLQVVGLDWFSGIWLHACSLALIKLEMLCARPAQGSVVPSYLEQDLGWGTGLFSPADPCIIPSADLFLPLKTVEQDPLRLKDPSGCTFLPNSAFNPEITLS